MKKREKERLFEKLPECVAEFIRLVIKKMRYRKKVRADVAAELTAHFEDELADCKTDEEKEQKAQKLIEDFGDAKLLAALIRRAKKRCRPIWQKTLVRTLVAITVIAFYLFLCSLRLIIGTPTIKFEYAQRLNEIVAGPAGSQNAKDYYDKAVAIYVDWAGKPNIIKTVCPLPGDFNDSTIEQLHKWLTSNQPAFDVLAEGASQRYYWQVYSKEDIQPKQPQANRQDVKKSVLTPIASQSKVVNNAMAPLPTYRKLAMAAAWKAAYETYTKNYDSALKTCINLQRFGSHLQGKGLLVEQVVGVAIEALPNKQLLLLIEEPAISSALLQKAQSQLEESYNRQTVVINLDAEKLLWDDIIQYSFTDDGEGGGRVIGRGIIFCAEDWKDSLADFVLWNYPDRQQIQQIINDEFVGAHQMLRKTPYQLRSDNRGCNYQNLGTKTFMLRILSPAYKKLGSIIWRLKTERIALVTVLATLRYEKEKGQYPESLNELVAASYLTELPIDPFSDKPLVYRKTTDGFMIYSVGPNFTDDGGKIFRDEKGKVKRYADEGDWVFWPAVKN